MNKESLAMRGSLIKKNLALKIKILNTPCSAFYDKKQLKSKKLTGKFISIYIWSLSVNYRENPTYNFAANVV
jgi:hypothetical protein